MRHERERSQGSTFLEPPFITISVALIAILAFLVIYVVRAEQRFSQHDANMKKLLDGLEKLVTREQADKMVKQIEKLSQQAESFATNEDVTALMQHVTAMQEQQTDIKDAIERGNPWERFSKNIKDVFVAMIESQESGSGENIYEYAVFRNGGFRTLTESSWNWGWRLMTSPYMTQDAGNFRLGGSVWIWGTADLRDGEKRRAKEIKDMDVEKIYHLYYYSTDKGMVTAARHDRFPLYKGNELREAEGGEGWFYRRLRK